MSYENTLFHENHVFHGFAFPAEEIEGVLGHGLSQRPFWIDSHHDLAFPAGENEGPTWNHQFAAEEIAENTKGAPMGLPRVAHGYPECCPSVPRCFHFLLSSS